MFFFSLSLFFSKTCVFVRYFFFGCTPILSPLWWAKLKLCVFMFPVFVGVNVPMEERRFIYATTLNHYSFYTTRQSINALDAMKGGAGDQVFVLFLLFCLS